MTGEDVKFTVEQNLRPDVQGGSARSSRNQLERVELPEKYTVVMHFKTPVWEVPSHFSQFVGYQNITSKKYLESDRREDNQRTPLVLARSSTSRASGGLPSLPGRAEPLAPAVGL